MPSLPGTQKNITTFITDFFLLFCVLPLPIIRKQIIILTQATYKGEEPQHVQYCDFPLLLVWLLYTVKPHITKLPLNNLYMYASVWVEK